LAIEYPERDAALAAYAEAREIRRGSPVCLPLARTITAGDWWIAGSDDIGFGTTTHGIPQQRARIGPRC